MSAVWSKRLSKTVVADIVVDCVEDYYTIKRVILHISAYPAEIEFILGDKEVEALEKLFQEAKEGVVNNGDNG